MICCSGRVHRVLRLLGRTRGIGAVVVVRWRSLRGRGLMRRATAHRTTTGRTGIAARGVVLPHVDTALRRARQFAYVVDGVVGSRVRMIGTLSHEFALRQETPLRAVAGDANPRVVSLLYIVIRRRIAHAYKIRPTNLRRCARV